MAEIKPPEGAKNIGQIQIADDVIAVIAGTAAQEVDGVTGAGGSLGGDVAAHVFGMKNLGKGVKVSVTGDEARIEMALSVRFGEKVPELCAVVQEKVKNAVETMTGLRVTAVDVNVSGVQSEKSKS